MMITKRRALALALAMMAQAACRNPAGEPVEATGTVEATEADLGFQTGGRVDSILVQEGDRIRLGQRLATMDRRELDARRAVAEAQLAAQQARLTELERGYRPEEIGQGQAAFRAAEQRLADAARDRTRSRNLFDGGAISRQSLDAAETAYALAEAERDRLKDQLQLLQNGPRQEQVAAQRALVAQAAASLEQARAALAFGEIVAPFDGTVIRRQREPGEVVSPGLPVLTLANPGDRWVRIYVREAEVGHVSLGQPAEISVDGFPDRRYQGEVSFISNEAEFTPRTVQTREERVKLVYRVKVRITGDSAVVLKPGLSADVVLSSKR